MAKKIPKHFFSEQTNGFYMDEIHGDNMPNDAVEVTETLKKTLIEQSSHDKVIRIENGAALLRNKVDVTALEDLISAKHFEIEQVRDISLANIDVTVTVSGDREFQADPKTMVTLGQAIALFNANGSTPAGYKWRGKDNVDHDADLALLVEIGMKRAEGIMSIWQASWDLKADLTAAVTKADVTAVVVPTLLS